MTQCVVVTGATGLVGSHLIQRLLRLDTDTVVVCIARSTRDGAAHQRVLNAIRTAWAAEEDQDPAEMASACATRIRVVDSPLVDPDSTLKQQLAVACAGAAVVAFWHCAANTSFADPNSPHLEAVNVYGTLTAMRAAASCYAEIFNHVSTAYVAGTNHGDIPERLHRDPVFHNEYERTKHVAEIVVKNTAGVLDMPYRIYRPGVVIGNSRTFKAARYSGLYDLLRLAQGLASQVEAGRATRRLEPVVMTVPQGATIHLVPINQTIEEMLWHHHQRSPCPDHIVHVCSEEGTLVHELMEAVLPACGIERFSISSDGEALSAMDKAFQNRIRSFMPYLSQKKRFLRTAACKLGRNYDSLAFPLEAVQITNYVKSFLEQTRLHSAVVREPAIA